ncbi:MAG: hypothetical protein GXN93_01545 [Candidatus Diapherotrites archaeon]|nr:hypothetical protein [Candidatus Diapherotrites archaeon]
MGYLEAAKEKNLEILLKKVDAKLDYIIGEEEIDEEEIEELKRILADMRKGNYVPLEEVLD